MTKMIDYYFTPVSPYAYLGHDRLAELVRRHGAAVAVKPIDLSRVFPVSGGLPLKQRAPQRQAYRLVEMARWAKHVGVPINLQPAHFPVSGDLASRWILAAAERDAATGLALAGALGRAVWVEERNIADAGALSDVAQSMGLDAAAIAGRAAEVAIGSRYDALTQEAITLGVFGAPTYVYAGELFWGQDRLDFLDRALAK